MHMAPLDVFPVSACMTASVYNMNSIHQLSGQHTSYKFILKVGYIIMSSCLHSGGSVASTFAKRLNRLVYLIISLSVIITL